MYVGGPDPQPVLASTKRDPKDRARLLKKIGARGVAIYSDFTAERSFRSVS